MFADFYKQDGKLSFINKRRRELENVHTYLTIQIEQNLLSTAQGVTATILEDSFKFCFAIFEFMTKTMVIQNHFQDRRGNKFERES